MESREDQEQEQVREYTEHIDKYRYRGSPLIKRVLSGDSTFKGEVGKFYGLFTWRVCGPMGLTNRVFSELKDKEPVKIGKFPKDLIRIIKPFSKEIFGRGFNFDVGKLSYGKLREDYLRHKNAKTKDRELSSVLKLLGFFPGIIYDLWSLEFRELQAMGTYPKPEETNYELKEFSRLDRTAEKADEFMDKHYRNHFIKEVLKNV